jgi:hypothetical protein
MHSVSYGQLTGRTAHEHIRKCEPSASGNASQVMCSPFLPTVSAA